jgi:hypothetical protein
VSDFARTVKHRLAFGVFVVGVNNRAHLRQDNLCCGLVVALNTVFVH